MLEENASDFVVMNMTTTISKTKFAFVKKLLLVVPVFGFLAMLAPEAHADQHHGFYRRHGYYRHHYYRHYHHYRHGHDYYRHGHRYYGYAPDYYAPRPGVHVSVGL